FGMSVGAGGRKYGGGAIRGAGAGGGAAARVNRLAKRRAEHGSIARSDGRQGQRIAALLRHRQANQAAAKFRHEVDGFGRDFFGGHGQVAFVLAVFIVHQDDHASRAYVFHRFFHTGEWWFSVGHLAPLAIPQIYHRAVWEACLVSRTHLINIRPRDKRAASGAKARSFAGVAAGLKPRPSDPNYL